MNTCEACGEKIVGRAFGRMHYACVERLLERLRNARG